VPECVDCRLITTTLKSSVCKKKRSEHTTVRSLSPHKSAILQIMSLSPVSRRCNHRMCSDLSVTSASGSSTVTSPQKATHRFLEVPDDYQREFRRANRRVAVPVKPEREHLMRKTNITQVSVSSTLASITDKQQQDDSFDDDHSDDENTGDMIFIMPDQHEFVSTPRGRTKHRVHSRRTRRSGAFKPGDRF